MHLFLSCAAAEKPIDTSPSMIMLEKKDHGSEIKIKKGELVHIRLETISGTGYQWHLDTSTLTHFQLESHQTVARNEDIKVGGPLLELWNLKSIKTGSAEVKLDYFRVWEGRARALEHFNIKVNIE